MTAIFFKPNPNTADTKSSIIECRAYIFFLMGLSAKIRSAKQIDMHHTDDDYTISILDVIKSFFNKTAPERTFDRGNISEYPASSEHNPDNLVIFIVNESVTEIYIENKRVNIPNLSLGQSFMI